MYNKLVRAPDSLHPTSTAYGPSVEKASEKAWETVKIEIQPPTQPLVLAWLGTPLITYADQALPFRTRKALALLVYLTTEAGIHTREKLTTLFWPESNTTRGRGMLRTSLAYLREALAVIDTPYLIVEPKTLSFAFHSAFELDLHHLQAGVDALQRQPAPAERGPSISLLQTAVNRYRGDFLAGFSLADAPEFDNWATLQREIWHSRMNLVFDTLSQWQWEAGDLPAALETAQRWRAHDAYGESAPQRLMQIHFAYGNRHDALQVYDAYTKMLATEFGGKPSPAIKTLAARIRARAPLRQDRAQTPPAVATTDLPFVGRIAEFTQLTAAYHAACQGRTQVVILEGEAGIGKTRLATEFLRWATAQGADSLAGRAFETGGELPYQPLAQLLRHQVEQEKDLTSLLSPIWLAELSRLLPEVRERYPDLPPTDANDTAAQSRLLESITRLGQALAERAPLVILVDDLQWADLSSLDALQYAISQWTVHKTTVFVLLCTRPRSTTAKSYLPQWLTTLNARLAVTQVSLLPLTVAETMTLVSALAPGQAVVSNPTQEDRASNSLDSDVVPTLTPLAQALFAETNGEPLYLVETIKSLVEQGVLVPHQTAAGPQGLQWRAVADTTTGSISLPRMMPTGVRTAILDRLARLTPAATALLTASAVLGQAATFEQLTAVSGVEQMAAVDALEELIAKRLLVESSHEDEGYLIAHDKIRDVVYNESSTIRRKILHQRAVAVLHRGDPARLAYHAQAAEMKLETFHASVDAGDTALHLFAAGDAIVHYEIAHKLFTAGQVPQVALDKVCHLYLSLGRALQLNAQFEHAGVIYQELRSLAQQRAAPAVNLAALTAEVTLRLRLSQALDLLEAEALAQEALRLARRLNDPVAETQILGSLMNCYRLSNRLPEALRCGDEALTLASALKLDEQRAIILSDLTKCHLFNGHLALADQAQQAAIQVWRSLHNLPMLADSLAVSALVARWRGNYEQALALSAEAYQINQATANIWGQSFSQMNIGVILWDRGEPEAAIAVMEKSIRLAEQANYLLPQILTRTDLGAAYASFGDQQRGLEQMRLALKLADTHLPIYRPYVIGLLARQHLLYNQLSEAEALLAQAKTEAHADHRSFLFQWVRFAEAELAFRQGNLDRVLVVTDAILEAIRQSEMRFLLSRVLFLRGQCFAAQGQPELAYATLLEARADVERSQSRYKLMQILAALARLERDPVQAAQFVQQAEEIKAYILSHSPPHLRAIFLNQQAQRMRLNLLPSKLFSF